MTQPSYPGVEYLPKQNSWKAIIRIDPDKFYLGTFSSFEKAKARRIEAEQAKAESDDPLNHPFFKDIKANATGSLKLSDDQVLEIRRAFREKNDLDYDVWTDKFNVTEKTIRKALNGDTYSHLNETVAPGKKARGKPHLREEVRKAYSEDRLTHSQIIAKYGISSATISHWTKDLVKRQTKPFLSKEEYAEKKRQARELYLQDKSCAEIGKILDMGHQAIARYCADFIAVKKADKSHWLRGALKSNQTKILNNAHSLRDEQVIMLRRRVSYSRTLHSKKWAVEFDTTPRIVLDAVKGVTYKHVNDRALPVTDVRDNNRSTTVPRQKKIQKILTSADILERRQKDTKRRQLKAAADRYEAWANAGFPDWGELITQ